MLCNAYYDIYSNPRGMRCFTGHLLGLLGPLGLPLAPQELGLLSATTSGQIYRGLGSNSGLLPLYCLREQLLPKY